MYQTLKDFQTFAAALVALAAAIIAFISAQMAAKTQAVASRAAVAEKHRLDEEAREAREAREQRAFAVLLDQFAKDFIYRLSSNCEVLKDIRRIRLGSQPQMGGPAHAQVDLLELATGRLSRMGDNVAALSFDYREIAAFEFHLQKSFYETRKWVARSQGLLEILLREVEQGDIAKASAQEKIVALEGGKSAVQDIRRGLTQYL